MSIKSRPLPLYKTVLFITCVVILVVNTASLYQNLRALRSANVEMEQSWDIKSRLQYLNVLISDAESSSRGYFLSNNDIYLGPLRTANSQIDSEFAKLRTALADSAGQTRSLNQLYSLFKGKLATLNANVDVYQHGGIADILRIARADEGKDLLDEIRLQVVLMVREQTEVEHARRQRFYIEYQYAVMLGIVINAMAIFVLLIFYRSIRMSFFSMAAVEDALHAANDNLEATVAARTAQLSVLSRHLVHVAEEEKTKLARELHDELGANLTAISMDIASVSEKLQDREPQVTRQLARARDTLLQTINFKRHIVENLRPSMLDHLGLSASLLNYCENFASITGVPCEARMPDDDSNIDAARAIVVFRITQESLNNITKYAQASRVVVTLTRQEDGLQLCIADDGVGIAPDALEKPMSHGLLGMRERTLLVGGTFAVRGGANGRGTVIEAFIPLDAA